MTNKAKFVDDLVKAMAGDGIPTPRQIEIAESIYAKTVPQPMIRVQHGISFWEWVFLILTVWACAVAYNYLNWQWQLDYDRTIQSFYNTEEGHDL